MQADDALWQRVHDVMHGRLERAFNEVTEAAAAREEQLAVRGLQAQLLPRAGALLDAAWPGWDVWEGVVGGVMRAVDAALTRPPPHFRPAGRRMRLHIRPSSPHSRGRQGPPLEWRVRQSGSRHSSRHSGGRRGRQMAEHLQQQSSSSPNSRHGWGLAAGSSRRSLWLLEGAGEARCWGMRRRELLLSSRQHD